MSCAALVLLKDELDIAEFTLRHLAEQVDWIFVSDNGSTDGTWELIHDLSDELPISLSRDPDPAYWQSKKMTAMAQLALERGHAWVLPCDADELFYSPDGRTVAQQLAGHAPDVQIVTAELYHHIPTALDPPAACERCGSTGMQWPSAGDEPQPCDACKGRVEPNPFRRIGWRKRERSGLGKVACRARPDLVIEAGNHSARTDGTATRAGGLVIRHYSWRSQEQYLKKLRNGIAAYAATDLPESTGTHWRMWEGKTDEQILEHFATWFWSADPAADDSMIYDPAPVLISGCG